MSTPKKITTQADHKAAQIQIINMLSAHSMKATSLANLIADIKPVKKKH